MHHYIDLEEDTFAETLPDLRGRFDAIMFCEVIEHIRASPQEQIGDLIELLRPGGYLIISTPNGLARAYLVAIMAGRQATTIYSRKRRKSGISRDFHVREYTPVELREAVAAAGGEVIREGLFDWYGDLRSNSRM